MFINIAKKLILSFAHKRVMKCVRRMIGNAYVWFLDDKGRNRPNLGYYSPLVKAMQGEVIYTLLQVKAI